MLLLDEIEFRLSYEVVVSLEIVLLVGVLGADSDSYYVTIIQEMWELAQVHVACFDQLLLFALLTNSFFNHLIWIQESPFELPGNELAEIDVLSASQVEELTAAGLKRLDCWILVSAAVGVLMRNLLRVCPGFDLAPTEQQDAGLCVQLLRLIKHLYHNMAFVFDADVLEGLLLVSVDPAEVPICWVEVSQPHAFVGYGSYLLLTSSLLEVIHRRYLLPEIIQLQGLADVDFAEKFGVVRIPSVGDMYAQMEFVISTK